VGDPSLRLKSSYAQDDAGFGNPPAQLRERTGRSPIDEKIPWRGSTGDWDCRGPSVAQRTRSFRMTMGRAA